MSLIDDMKEVQQTITDFMEKMDSIKSQFRSDMKSLKTAGMIVSRKTVAKPNNSIDSDRDEIETPKVNQKQVHPQSPRCSDDEFLCGPVSQKPKKPLCLSIKRSAKNRPKCTTDRRLMDVVKSEERKVPKNQANSEEKTRISISWTIKIKESSAQQTNQVSITGSEQIDWTNAGLGKSLSDPEQCNFEELEFQQSISNKEDGSSNGLPEVLETVETLNNEGVRRCRNENEREYFEECRVVIRKLSTSRKIFQPKVVLQKLTNDEIDRICGSFQGVAEQGNSNAVEPEDVPAVRYTSLILEPARKSPRVFSTVKMRSSVMRLVLTPPQMIKPKSDIKKSIPEQSCNEMVKSMFKRSKCVQEWRARARTKDAGQCVPNARNSLDSQERHPGVIQWNAGTSQPRQPRYETKRSKFPQGKERNLEAEGDKRKTELNSPTIDSNNRLTATFGKPVDNPNTVSILMKPERIEEPIPRSKDIDEKNSSSDQENFHKNTIDNNGCKSVKFEKLKVEKESGLRKITDEPKSKIRDKKSWNFSQNPDGAGAVSKYQPDLAGSTQEFEISDIGKGGQFTKSSTEPDNEKAMTVNDLDSVPRRGKTASQMNRGSHNKTPQKMVLITPTRLKYTVKTRNILNATPIHGGRVTRSRIKIEHARTDSGTRPKNGNMFPGSQLTFLIESFRR